MLVTLPSLQSMPHLAEQPVSLEIPQATKRLLRTTMHSIGIIKEV